MTVLVVLPKDGIQSLLDLGALQGIGLGHDHLFLLLGDVGFRQKMPTLNFCRKFDRKYDTMLFDSAKSIVMVSDELKEALTTSASLTVEVSSKICRHLNLAVILEGRVQQGKNVLQGSVAASRLQVKVLDGFPCCALQRTKQVQHTLAFPIHQFHYLGIDDDSFSPLLVIRGSAIENRDVAIASALLIQDSTTCARSSCTFRQNSLQGSPGRGEKLQLSK